MWKNRLLGSTILRAPEGTGGGGGDTNNPPARPDYVPEKFWDGQKGVIRADDLAKSYGEATKLIGKKASELNSEDYKTIVTQRTDEIRREVEADRRKNAPGKLEEYKLELSAEQLKSLPEGMFDAEKFTGDPLVDWWRKTAFESGMSQEQFGQGIHAYLGVVHAHQQAVYEEQLKALGSNAKQRLEGVQMWLSKNLSKEHAAALTSAGVTADAIGALETIIAKAGGPSVLPNTTETDPNQQGGKKTMAELRAMQQDRRYWHPRDKDPAYIAQVQAEYARAFPGAVPV